jgi:hypothetical protein
MNATAAPRAPAAGDMALPRNGFLRIVQPEGWRIDCMSGSAWITHDGDPRDTLLHAGDSHRVDHADGALLLQALDDCHLRLVGA